MIEPMDTSTEPQGFLSPAEERFERLRRTTGLFVGPLVFLLLWFLPMPSLSEEAHRLAAVVSLVAVWWVTEAIPIPATGLIGCALAVLTGVAEAEDTLAPFASPIIFVFIGSFMIAKAIAEHGLDRHLAFSLLALKGVRGSVVRIRAVLGGFTLLASAFLGNTALAAMMLPVALGVLRASFAQRDAHIRVYETGFLLTIAYAASIGGMMSPVGTAPNLITIGLLDELAGIKIDFFTWMLLGIPISFVMGVVLLVMGGRLYPAPAGLALDFSQDEKPQARWSRGQLNSAIAFGTVVTLWLTPGLVALFGFAETPVGAWVSVRLNEGISAIIAAGLLFVLPTDWSQRRFTLSWQQAARIDWGTILLFGAGISLGRLMFISGLAEHIGTLFVAVSGADTLWTVTAMAIVLGIVLTEFTSNTAATNMLVPVMLTICYAAGLNPVPPTLGVCLGTSMAFMLPISTPPNAFVYSTGRVPVTAMLKWGLILDAIGFVVIFCGLRLVCPLLGFV